MKRQLENNRHATARSWPSGESCKSEIFDEQGFQPTLPPVTASLDLPQKGKATDPIEYFAAPEHRDLGIVKSPRKPNVKLIVAPFPDRQQGLDQYFFETSSQIPLTTAIQA